MSLASLGPLGLSLMSLGIALAPAMRRESFDDVSASLKQLPVPVADKLDWDMAAMLDRLPAEERGEDVAAAGAEPCGCCAGGGAGLRPHVGSGR